MNKWKKPKILVVGSFMMDLISSAERLPSMGETVIGTEFKTAPGGKGANQAVQCARLGADVTMVGCVGEDAFGHEMRKATSAAGVDVTHVSIGRSHASGVGNVQLQVAGGTVQNRILVVPGANYDLLPSELSWLEQQIAQYDMVLLQLEIPMETTTYVAKIAKSAGVPVMLNPAPAAPLDAELLSNVTYLSPNEHEAALLAEHPIRTNANGVDWDDLDVVAQRMRSRGVENLIVTLGDNGSAFFGAEGSYHCPCIKVDDVKDPTAAGDSFVAAFCTGRAAGFAVQQALQFASYTAARTVCAMGAMPSLPTLAEVRSFMRERDSADFDISLLDVLAKKRSAVCHAEAGK